MTKHETKVSQNTQRRKETTNQSQGSLKQGVLFAGHKGIEARGPGDSRRLRRHGLDPGGTN